MTEVGELRYLTVKRCAVILDVSKMTIYRLCENGAIASIRVGRSIRVSEQDFIRYTSKGTT